MLLLYTVLQSNITYIQPNITLLQVSHMNTHPHFHSTGSQHIPAAVHYENNLFCSKAGRMYVLPANDTITPYSSACLFLAVLHPPPIHLLAQVMQVQVHTHPHPLHTGMDIIVDIKRIIMSTMNHPMLICTFWQHGIAIIVCVCVFVGGGAWSSACCGHQHNQQIHDRVDS